MRWILPENRNILSQNEGTIIEPIKFEIEGSNNYEIIKVSGEFPQGIELIKENDGYYYLEGKLGYVPETTTFYFTLQATDLDTNEELEHWYSMEVVTLNTTWCGIVYECLENNVNERPDIALNTIWKQYNGVINDELCEEKNVSEWDKNKHYNVGDLVIYNNNEIVEKMYFQKQFKLKNPEGNEVFRKVSGELPEGLTFSETGLLYGVPEENRDEPYYFVVGAYRLDDDKLIEVCKSEILTINVKDISSINKPIWLTDEGILDYVNYNIPKQLQFVAYDYNGREVNYKITENNLPYDITFDEDTVKTGILKGKCLTQITKEWAFKIQPYSLDGSNRIYGDEREFIIVTNAIETNNIIHWITESIDPMKIGYTYNLYLIAESGRKITYEVVAGNLPKGLTLNKKGNLYGTVDYQQIGDYTFVVRAYNAMSFSERTFTISVQKGLSENALDVYLYFNKEYQPSYQQLLLPFDRTSAYNSSNSLYKIPSTPKISIATLNTWDNVLLKYKFNEQFNGIANTGFNTPIELIMRETGKKTFTDYDFFYKKFSEVSKISEPFDLKLHSEDETVMETPIYHHKFKPGYIRNNVIGTPVVEYWSEPDGQGVLLATTNEPKTMEHIEKHLVEYDLNGNIIDDKTNYHWTEYDEDGNLVTDIIVYPKYLPSRESYDYHEFGLPYVKLRTENDKIVYVSKVSKGRYYEIETKRMVHTQEPIYIRAKKQLTGEDEIYTYILRDNVEYEVGTLVTDGYASFDPNYIEPSVWIDPKTYYKVEYDKNASDYYWYDYQYNNVTSDFDDYIYSVRNMYDGLLLKYTGENKHVVTPQIIRGNTGTKMPCQTASIEAIRQIFAEPIYVSQINGNVWYKVGNQEILYKEDGSLEDFANNEKILNHKIKKIGESQNARTEIEFKKMKRMLFKYDEHLDIYYINDEKFTAYMNVYAKMDNNTYKKIFAKYGDEYKELVQKTIIVDGDVEYKFYVVYPKVVNNRVSDRKVPFTDCLITLDWDRDSHYICKVNEYGDYEWFKVQQIQNPYVYYANRNTEYGYDKDIVLPNVSFEHLNGGVLKFLDLEEEPNLLPECMRAELPDWETEYEYNVGDEVIYKDYIYKCITKHASTLEFDESKWENEGHARSYQPLLPLYYAKSKSHNTSIKYINADEKLGHNWYGRKLIFYEIHFESKYKKDVDNFTIDFYNNANENHPEFQLI